MGIALALAPVAGTAGTLTSATWTQNVEGFYLYGIDLIPSIALTVTNSGATCTDSNPYRVPGAGSLTCPTAGLQATGTSTASSYNVALTMPLFQFQGFTTGGTIPLATRASLQGGQTIAGGSASATANVGIEGMVTFGGAQHTMGSMWNQPLMGTLAFLPIYVGKADRGGFYSTFSPPYSGDFFFYGWTPGTLSFTGLSTRGVALPDVIAMGTFGLGANGAGAVTLVSPSRIFLYNWEGGSQVSLVNRVTLATLKLTFVPEPSAMLLLGAGALALVGYGRRS